MTLTREDCVAFAQKRRTDFEADLKALVEVPSISASPQHKDDMARVASLARDLIHRHGGEARILETDGFPLVHGRFAFGPDVPTVTVYNHLDVQPAGEPEWRTPPFHLIQEGDTYRGRGSTDDKGPALTALYAAVLAKSVGVPVNIQFLWETEEEIGSPSFEAAIRQHRAELTTDSVVVSDTIWLTRGKPSTPLGLRGMQAFSIVLETADHDLHSGLVGGAARNPLTELAGLIGEMVDGATGEVKIPGFYDEVEALSGRERDEFLASGFSVETFKKDHHIHSLRRDDPLGVMYAVWARPTLEVHGIVGGYVGPGIKSAVPGKAEIKCSCRLVPNMRGQTTLDRVRAFVEARIPDAKVYADARLEPYKGEATGPFVEAIEHAYRFGFGQTAAFTREGGSIGAVPSMNEVLGVPVYFLGLSLPEHGYHAPNENYDWDQVEGGIPAFFHYFTRVALL